MHPFRVYNYHCCPFFFSRLKQRNGGRSQRVKTAFILTLESVSTKYRKEKWDEKTKQKDKRVSEPPKIVEKVVKEKREFVYYCEHTLSTNTIVKVN